MSGDGHPFYNCMKNWKKDELQEEWMEQYFAMLEELIKQANGDAPVAWRFLLP